MRFMMLMIPKGYESAAPGAMPDTKAVEAMMKYNEELQKAGVLLALDGLHPPSMGARVSFTCDTCPSDLKATIIYVSPRAEFTPPVIYSQTARSKLVFLIEARPEPTQVLLPPGLPVTVAPFMP